MKILVACEYSGIVRDAFREFGHDAFSCDFLPSDSENTHHYLGDVLEIIDKYEFDMMIAHPPCTYLCCSGLHWNTKTGSDGFLTDESIERCGHTEDALEFISSLWNCNIPRICIENPVGCINTRLVDMPKPQYIQPYEYGHDASKRTGLWLKNLPMLVPWPDDYIAPRVISRNGRSYNRWANQTPAGQDSTAPSATRGKDRAKTYSGVAYAMVEAWGNL
jgi:hypothetical protein